MPAFTHWGLTSVIGATRLTLYSLLQQISHSLLGHLGDQTIWWDIFATMCALCNVTMWQALDYVVSRHYILLARHYMMLCSRHPVTV